MPMVTLGKWAPDAPEVGSAALLVARNTLPRVGGYDSMPGLTSAELGTLNNLCRGAYSGRGSGGQNFTVGGTISRIYLGSTGNLANVSRGGAGASPYAVPADGWWDFCLYGNRVIATNYADPIDSFVIGTSTEFAALDADSPLSRHLAVVRNFVVAGNIVGRGSNAGTIGTAEDGVQWSAVDDPSNWPQVGTSTAAGVQSDWQALGGDGGGITDIVGGSDFGIIFRDRSIWRMDYEGGDTFFRFTPISENLGCIVPKAAIRVGGVTYFISEEGFHATNGAEIAPIGNSVVDRYFIENIQPNSGYRVSRMHVPSWKCIAWAFMSTDASVELCDSLLLYNYVDDRWSTALTGVEWLVDVMPFTDSLDSYSDSMDSGALSAVSLDTLLGASVRTPGAFMGTTHALGTFTGNPSIATIQTDDFEITPGRVSMVRSVRPVYDSLTGLGINVRVGSRYDVASAAVFGGTGVVDSTGKCNARQTGRYHRANLVVSGGFSGLNGIDVDAVANGAR